MSMLTNTWADVNLPTVPLYGRCSFTHVSWVLDQSEVTFKNKPQELNRDKGKLTGGSISPVAFNHLPTFPLSSLILV